MLRGAGDELTNSASTTPLQKSLTPVAQGAAETTAPRAGYSAAAHLIVYGVAIALPLLLVLGLLLVRSLQSERNQLESRIVRVVEDVASSLDRDFDRHQLILQTLATSQLLHEEDWRSFYERAKASLQGRAYIILVDASGHQLVNTYVPYGEQPQTTGDPETVRRMLAGKRPVISDLFVSLVAKQPVFNVSIPVLREGQVRHVLSLGLLPDDVRQLLIQQSPGPEWVITVWDTNGAVIAQSRDPDRFVGTVLPEALRFSNARRPVDTLVGTSDETVLRAAGRSALSGWGVSVEVPVENAETQMRTAAWLWGGTSVLAIALAVGLGLIFGRFLTGPLSAVAGAAAALGRGDRFKTVPSRLEEANSLVGVLRDAERELGARTTALRESERRLAAVLDALPVGIGLTDSGGRTLVGNRLYSSFVPEIVPPHDEARHDLWEAYDADGRRVERDGYPAARALRGEQVWPGVDFLFHGDLERGPFWVRVGALPLLDERGAIVGATVAITDIDRLKREEEVRARYVRMLDSAFDAIIVRDAEDLITAWNRGAERLYGWTREEAVGRISHSLFQTSFPEPIDRILADTVRNGVWQGELIHTRKDGTRVTVLSRWTPERDAQGRTRSILETNTDITERKAAEEHFRLAVEAAPNGMILSDGEGRIILVNAQAEKMFGYGRDEMIGQKIEMLVPERLRGLHPVHRATYMAQPGIRSMGAGRDLFARRKDGTELPVEIGLSPVATTKGRMVLCGIVDITDRKLAQESRDLIMRELEHRTKNVLGVAQAIAGRTLDETKTFAEAKLVIGGRLRALGQAYSTMAEGHWVGASLREIVDRQLASMPSRIDVAGCEIVVTASAAQQFALIIHELLTNALKYGALSVPDGRVSIEGKVDRSDGDGVFTFIWREAGGPAVSPPSRTGFGSFILLESAKPLADAVTTEYSRTGLVYRLRARLKMIEASRS
jgi:PAS domain S-box-containing protein